MSIDWNQAVIAPVMSIFGEAVNYRPRGGASFDITGVFNEAYLELDAVGDTVPRSDERAMLSVRLVEFLTQAPRQGDALTVMRTGETYRVREVRTDGHGGACLLLNTGE